MVLQMWGDKLTTSFQGLWMGVIAFIPNLIVALVIFFLGWLIGSMVAKIVARFMHTLKFDEALKQAGVEDVVKRGGLNLNSGKFVGGIIKYFVITVFLIASFDVLGLAQVTDFLKQIVVDYLPRLIVGILILLVGTVVGDVMSRIVTASSRSAGVSSAGVLGTLTKWAIWIFSLLITLSQVGIGGGIIQTLFTGMVVALSLGFGLSFGLGGQEAAKKAIEKIQHEMSHNH